MKTKKILYVILMFLPLLVVMTALPFLPEQIPAHYDFEGQVTRWGSKYETLIFPALTLVFGAFMLFMAKIAAKQEGEGKNNEKVTIMTGIVSLLLFNAMTGYWLYTDFNKVENLSAVSVDVYQLVFGILGVFMLVIGNLMPKLKMNSVIGFRTASSMKNETVWKKTQHFAGISMMAGGLLTLIVSVATKGMTCLILSMVILLAITVLDSWYACKAAKSC